MASYQKKKSLQPLDNNYNQQFLNRLKQNGAGGQLGFGQAPFYPIAQKKENSSRRSINRVGLTGVLASGRPSTSFFGLNAIQKVPSMPQNFQFQPGYPAVQTRRSINSPTKIPNSRQKSGKFAPFGLSGTKPGSSFQMVPSQNYLVDNQQSLPDLPELVQATSSHMIKVPSYYQSKPKINKTQREEQLQQIANEQYLQQLFEQPHTAINPKRIQQIQNRNQQGFAQNFCQPSAEQGVGFFRGDVGPTAKLQQFAPVPQVDMAPYEYAPPLMKRRSSKVTEADKAQQPSLRGAGADSQPKLTRKASIQTAKSNKSNKKAAQEVDSEEEDSTEEPKLAKRAPQQNLQVPPIDKRSKKIAKSPKQGKTCDTLNNQQSSDMSSQRGAPRKRGRKRNAWPLHVATVREKIRRQDQILADGKNTLSAKKKEQHRNIKSAAQSRLRKEFENRWLYNVQANQDEAAEQILGGIIDVFGEQKDKMERLRQLIGAIESESTNPDPNPEEDPYPPKVKIPPTPLCLIKQKNGKLQSTDDYLEDFRETWREKLVTKEHEKEIFRHNEEKPMEFEDE